MLLTNLDVVQGYVNGSTPIIKRSVKNVVFMETKKGETLLIRKRKQELKAKAAQIAGYQYPSIPAYAMTMHKAQSQTLEHMAIGLDK